MVATEAVAKAKLNATAATTRVTHGKHIAETACWVACDAQSRAEHFPFFKVVMDITIKQERELLLELAAAAPAAATNASSHFGIGSVSHLRPWVVMRARPATIAFEMAHLNAARAIPDYSARRHVRWQHTSVGVALVHAKQAIEPEALWQRLTTKETGIWRRLRRMPSRRLPPVAPEGTHLPLVSRWRLRQTRIHRLR